MSISNVNGVTAANISAINGVTKTSIADIGGITAGFGSSGGTFPAGLTVWARYKASDMVAVGDGNKVGQWDDKTGNARHLTQATANSKPVLRTAASGLVGNTVAIDFQITSGNPHIMDVPDMSTLTEGEIFFYMKKDDDDGVTPRRLHQIGTATDFYYVYLDHSIYDGFGSTVRKSAGNPAPSLTNWHMYSIRSKPSDWQCYINNTSVFSTGTNTVGFPSSSTIGGYFPDTSIAAAQIAEIVILSTATDSTGRANMLTYFQDEYA